eukprot:15430825-Alexandrium_andersonii.AAC.1
MALVVGVKWWWCDVLCVLCVLFIVHEREQAFTCQPAWALSRFGHIWILGAAVDSPHRGGMGPWQGQGQGQQEQEQEHQQQQNQKDAAGCTLEGASEADAKAPPQPAHRRQQPASTHPQSRPATPATSCSSQGHLPTSSQGHLPTGPTAQADPERDQR